MPGQGVGHVRVLRTDLADRGKRLGAEHVREELDGVHLELRLVQAVVAAHDLAILRGDEAGVEAGRGSRS
jgi:hypothetical protein